MTDNRFTELGFKAGLEIHQQLSGKKLFCRCDAVVREDEPDFSVTRILRASAGESGELDVAASHEESKSKEFVYNGYHDSTCLVELDEEPVSQVNPGALDTALVVAELLSMKRFDKVHVMRKVVVDGSNTSGFQRTMAVASDGLVHDGVRVDRLCLEEDSCRIVERSQTQDVYNLSRLGIPLLEITTKPDITSPTQLQEVASELGMVLRSTQAVRRGLGTIRQDVNISIAKGSRVEIKGVQDLDGMPLIAENEVSRQSGLVKLADELSEVVVGNPIKLSEAFSSSSGWVKQAVSSDQDVVGVRVQDFAGILGRELFEGFRVGTEIAGYAKAWGFGGIIHGDEKASKYGLSSWDDVQSLLSCSSDDSFVLLVGSYQRTQDFIESVLRARIQALAHGVPACVRKANSDASTTYLRPLPGAARMYPETDVHPVSIQDAEVDIPELLTHKSSRLSEEFDISEDVAWQICRYERADMFESWASRLEPSLVADVLVVKEKELRRRHNLEVNVLRIAPSLFERIESGQVSKSAVEDILVSFAQEGSVDWSSYESVDEDEVREIIKKVIRDDPDAPFGALMGQAMSQLQGKADGKLVSSLLREELS